MSYQEATKKYAAYGVDVEKAMKRLKANSNWKVNSTR